MIVSDLLPRVKKNRFFVLGVIIFFYLFLLSSSATRAWDTVTATVRLSVCGDFVAEGTEECDSNDLRSATCRTQGYFGGDLSCDVACEYDESQCFGVAPSPSPTPVLSPTPVATVTPTSTPAPTPTGSGTTTATPPPSLSASPEIKTVLIGSSALVVPSVLDSIVDELSTVLFRSNEEQVDRNKTQVTPSDTVAVATEERGSYLSMVITSARAAVASFFVVPDGWVGAVDSSSSVVLSGYKALSWFTAQNVSIPVLDCLLAQSSSITTAKGVDVRVLGVSTASLALNEDGTVDVAPCAGSSTLEAVLELDRRIVVLTKEVIAVVSFWFGM